MDDADHEEGCHVADKAGQPIALGKARKVGAEGESLKLVSYFYSVFRVKLYLYAKSRRLFPISVIWLSDIIHIERLRDLHHYHVPRRNSSCA